MVILIQTGSLQKEHLLIQSGFPSNVCFSVNVSMNFQVIIYKPLAYTVSFNKKLYVVHFGFKGCSLTTLMVILSLPNSL